jgi:hypothetical protein
MASADCTTELRCPVCYDEIDPDEVTKSATEDGSQFVVQTHCKHIVCVNCFDRLKAKNKCPICRQKMVESDDIEYTYDYASDEDGDEVDSLALSMTELILRHLMNNTRQFNERFHPKTLLMDNIANGTAEINGKQIQHQPIQKQITLLRMKHSVKESDIKEVQRKYTNCSDVIAVQAIAYARTVADAIFHLDRYT